MFEAQWVQWSAFGMGHVLNDLVACGWFSFYLVYLTHVLLMSDVESGILLFIGQVADALATPIVGILSDRCGLGRKFFLGVGYIMVGLTYPLMYERCPFVVGPGAQFWYLAVIIVLFQFGWAAGQISHLALLTDIGGTSTIRTLLNSIRFGATVSANLTVFLSAFVVLAGGSDRVTPADAPKFRLLAWLMCAVGAVCSVLCLVGVKLPEGGSRTTSLTLGQRTTWWQWFLRMDFYQAAILYMCARLIANTVQVYLQLYVVETLGMRPFALAVVPTCFFVGQMVASMMIPLATQYLSSESIFVMGTLGIGGGCLLTYLADRWTVRFIYAGSSVTGIGCGMVMVISLAIVADLVSTQKRTAAWVYGLMSFADKLSGGLVLLIIQNGLNSFGSFRTATAARGEYLLNVVSVLPVLISLLAFLTMLSVLHLKPPVADDNGDAAETDSLLREKGGSARREESNAMLDLVLNESRFGWNHWYNAEAAAAEEDLWSNYIPVP
eukprot:EG_transcript_7932